MNKIERNNSYDLLRVLSCLAVILLHVNFLYFGDKALTPSNSYLWIIESLINIITRFCVPCFVMISGAFLISDERNADFIFFYKKRLLKVFLPSLIIGLSLYLFSIIKYKEIVMYTTQLIEGTFYNYWYIFMTIGLYLITPIVIRIKRTLTLNQYKLCALVLLVWSIISQATTIYRFPYAIGVVVAFLSYFIIGNIIYENYRKDGLNLFTLTIICVLSITFAFVWRYLGHNNRMFVYEAYSNFFSPFIVCYSICLFTIFTKINIKTSFSNLSKLTLYIYLFHTIVYQFIYKIVENNMSCDEVLKIIIIFIITFVLSLILSIIFNKTYKWWFKNKI